MRAGGILNRTIRPPRLRTYISLPVSSCPDITFSDHRLARMAVVARLESRETPAGVAAKLCASSSVTGAGSVAASA